MNTTDSPQEETLADLMKEIWSGRGFVLAGLAIGLILAVAFMVVAVPHSRAKVILAPANPMNMAATQPVQSGLQERSLSQEELSFARFEASFKGAAVAGLLLRDPEITAGLQKDRAFKFFRTERGWTPEKLADYIGERVKVDPVGETPLRTLSYLHPDKDFAVSFLHRLHNVTDGLIRHSMRKDVNERIAYLNMAIAETMHPDHRRAMTDLLMEQERLKMLVSIDQPYAASVVVPAAYSVKAVWPDPALLFVVFAAVGAFLGFVVFSIRKLEAQDILAAFERVPIKQQEWFFPESGNENEKPEPKKPLTGKKPKKPKRKKPDTPSEAAE